LAFFVRQKNVVLHSTFVESLDISCSFSRVNCVVIAVDVAIRYEVYYTQDKTQCQTKQQTRLTVLI